LPLLTIDAGKPTEKKLAQSLAILEFVGKLGNSPLYPSDPWKAARVVEILCALEDLSTELGPSMREQDPEKKKALRVALANGAFPNFLSNLEKNLCEGPFVLGSELSIADIKLAGYAKFIGSGTLDHIPKEITDKYEKLQKLKKAVYEHPKIAEYYANKAKKN